MSFSNHGRLYLVTATNKEIATDAHTTKERGEERRHPMLLSVLCFRPHAGSPLRDLRSLAEPRLALDTKL